MYQVKVYIGESVQTLEFGDKYIKFSTFEILDIVKDLLGEIEATAIKIEKI